MCRFIFAVLVLYFACLLGCQNTPVKPPLIVLTKPLAFSENILVENSSLRIPKDAKYGGTLRLALPSRLNNFNWITQNSPSNAAIQSLVHDGFTQTDFNAPGNRTPALAHKVEISKDKKVYTLHFRDDVFWQSPIVDFSKPGNAWLEKRRKFTAHDAAFYFELVSDPEVQAGTIKSYYETFEKVEVVDDFTLKVHWKTATFSSKSATLDGYPIPKWIYSKTRDGKDIKDIYASFNNHWAAEHAIGTGPYQVTFHDSGSETILERSDFYWGTKYPIQKIEYHVNLDPLAAYSKFKGGEFDFIRKIPSRNYENDLILNKETKFKNGSLISRQVDVFAYHYFGWNQRGPYFSDKRVRRAMTHAFNRQSFIDETLMGLGTIQTGPFFHKHPATDPSIQPLPFDLKAAALLLDEAGWVDTDGDGIRDKIIGGESVEFEFTMVAYDTQQIKTMLNIFKENLKKIGIILNAQHVNWPTMRDKMNEKNFDAFTGGWGVGWEINPNQIWHSQQADVPMGSNVVGFKNEEADRIIEALLLEFDPKKRIELARKFHAILHEEQPYTFLYAPKTVMAWRKGLKNVIINQTRPQTLPFPWYFENE